MSWSEGYFSELNYLHGYYKGMNPLWMRFVCLLTGQELPARKSCNYLELGFGRGLSLAVHAAANEGRFWGADFNASHAVEAMEMGGASHSDVTILDASFKQLAARDDLPEFDFICLHGVWSWISEDNRAAIVDLISTRLRVGGLVYISYNCLPGWSSIVPVRELMALHHQLAGRLDEPETSVVNSVVFAADVLTAQPGHLLSNSTAETFIKSLISEGKRNDYIAHEYLNRDWYIPTFAKFMSELERAKLSFVGHTQPLNNFDKFRLNAEARKIMDGLGHQPLRETVRDYFLNTRFRCDVLIKGARDIPAEEFRKRWLPEYFVLTSDASEHPSAVITPLGEMKINGSAAARVAEVLRRDRFRPKSVREIHECMGDISLAEIIDILVLFVDATYASPACIPDQKAVERCRNFNRYVLRRAHINAEIQYLASPVTGGGISVSRLSLLFITAWEAGRQSVDELAAYAEDVIFEGHLLPASEEESEKRAEQIENFHIKAREFVSSSLPVIQALVVV